MSELVQAALLGLVEGATEFIPVSSTGHLILVGHFIGFTGERAALFEIVIQLGAILAVVWNYRLMLAGLLLASVKPDQVGRASRRLTMNIIIAFLPAALLGLFAHRWITSHLFSPRVVAVALIAGGLVILVIERVKPEGRVAMIDGMQPSIALGIGFAQAFSLIPGVSRSAATIVGAMALGVERPAAAEFSFLLAIPVMFAATGLGLFESASVLGRGDLPIFAVGFVTAFGAALVAIRLLLRLVSRHSFAAFAWYRIVVGSALAILLF